MRPSYFSYSAISVLCASVFPGRENALSHTCARAILKYIPLAGARAATVNVLGFSYDEQRISYRFPARGLFL